MHFKRVDYGGFDVNAIWADKKGGGIRCSSVRLWTGEGEIVWVGEGPGGAGRTSALTPSYGKCHTGVASPNKDPVRARGTGFLCSFRTEMTNAPHLQRFWWEYVLSDTLTPLPFHVTKYSALRKQRRKGKKNSDRVDFSKPDRRCLFMNLFTSVFFYSIDLGNYIDEEKIRRGFL